MKMSSSYSTSLGVHLELDALVRACEHLEWYKGKGSVSDFMAANPRTMLLFSNQVVKIADCFFSKELFPPPHTHTHFLKSIKPLST